MNISFIKWLLIHLQAAVGVRTLRNQGAKNIAIDVMTNEHGILISFNFFCFFFSLKSLFLLN